MGKKKGAKKKESSDDENEILCPCGSAKGSRYWILCDGCETWYHGKCANFTEKQIATIDKFFCHDCCDKNSKLATTYKVTKETKKAAKAKEVAAQNPSLPPSSSYSSELLIQTPAQAQSIAVHAHVDDEALAAAIPMAQTKTNEIVEKLTQQALSGELNMSKELVAELAKYTDGKNPGQKTTREKKSLIEICARLMLNPQARQVPKRCGECPGCKVHVDCEKCIACFENRECLQRVCIKAPIVGEYVDYCTAVEEMTHDKVVATYKKKKKEENVVFGKKPVQPRLTNHTMQIHCNGPGCVNSSRPGSKYCSHECGLEQARRRLLLVLPTRVQNYCKETPAVFEREAKEVIEIEQRLAEMQNNMNSLTDTRTFVIKYLEDVADLNAKQEKANAKAKKSETEKEKTPTASESKKKRKEADYTGRCTVCGFSTNNWGSLQRHIQRCYMRLEKKTDFTSPMQATHNPDGIICDFFCKKEGAYCKRLRVLCFDHTKGFLYEKNSICGAPLGFYDDDVAYNLVEPLDKEQFMKGGVCMLNKDACHRHVNWAQSLLGAVDNTRVSLIQTMSELSEKVRYLRDNVNRCYDIPNLLQCYTITKDTDAFGMPKTSNFVTGLPDYFDRKLDWSKEVKEINERIQEKLNVRFAEQERLKDIDKKQKEAAKAARLKKRGKKKPGPPAKKRVTAAAARAAAAKAAAAAAQTAAAKAAAAAAAAAQTAATTSTDRPPTPSAEEVIERELMNLF